MLNDSHLEAWEDNMLEAIIRSDYASLELVIINKTRNDTTTYFDKYWQTGKNYCIMLYTKLENRIVQM